MVVQVVTEQLNVRDRGRRYRRIGKMAREQDERDVSGIFCVSEVGQMSNLQRWIAA